MPGVPDLIPPLAEILPRSLGPYIALMFIGFVLGTMGHVIRSRWMVAVGIILIFLATFLFPLALNLTSDDRPPDAKRFDI